jgi:hypothetical protein
MKQNPMWKIARLLCLGVPASALLAGCSSGPVPLGSESEAIGGGHRPGSSSGGSGSSSGGSSSGGTVGTNGGADASSPIAASGVWTQRFAPTPIQGWVAVASNSTGEDLIAVASLGGGGGRDRRRRHLDVEQWRRDLDQSDRGNVPFGPAVVVGDLGFDRGAPRGK